MSPHIPTVRDDLDHAYRELLAATDVHAEGQLDRFAGHIGAVRVYLHLAEAAAFGREPSTSFVADRRDRGQERPGQGSAEQGHPPRDRQADPAGVDQD